jgi:hypothetical protein
VRCNSPQLIPRCTPDAWGSMYRDVCSAAEPPPSLPHPARSSSASAVPRAASMLRRSIVVRVHVCICNLLTGLAAVGLIGSLADPGNISTYAR